MTNTSGNIPVPLIAVVAEVMADHYTHTQINSHFFAAGFAGDPPVGNKVDKCHEWLRQANKENPAPLEILGKLIEELMETTTPPEWQGDHPSEVKKTRIRTQLAAHGLSYIAGGHIVQLGTTVTSRSLGQIIRDRDLKGVQNEFERIFVNLEIDPAAAVTASCALLEALFKTYITDESLALPADQSILPLWKIIRDHLKLNPAEFQDDSLRKILGGLASIVDGTASLRTKYGSAHGHDGRKEFRVKARHARLASHSALTLATFLIEVSDSRKAT